MKEKKLHIASWILVGLLLLPLLQQVTGIFNEEKLKGAKGKAEYPSWNWKDYFGGSLQGQLGEALNDRAGFRPFFIRINNQVAFSLYREAKARGVIIGKNNYMFEKIYILASQGKDYVGDSLILSNAEKLRVIQDTLHARGKHLVVTFAAGKGSFYPEYVPDRYKMPSPDTGKKNGGSAENSKQGTADSAFVDRTEHLKTTNSKGAEIKESEAGRCADMPLTNLEAYKQAFGRQGVNYIDFNSWFLQMKDTSRYCLYPRTGVHWSYYGMVLVIDSLRNYLAQVTGQPMPEFEWGDVKLSRRYRSSDRDIEDGMNILFRVNRDKMAYPEISFHDEGYEKIRGAVIADSFYWGLHNIGFSHRILKEGEFWYYFKRIYGNHLENIIQVDEIDPWKRLQQYDVIILMATEATLTKFPFGFVETVCPQIESNTKNDENNNENM